MFSTNDIKTLREMTGAGMLDCKKALEESNGNMDAAVDWLREKGISKASKKEARIAAEGLTEILTDGNTAVMIEVNSETDFVAKNEEFKSFLTLAATTVLNGNVTDLENALDLATDNGSLRDVLTALVAKIGEKISFRRFVKVTKNDDEVFGKYLHMGGKIGVLAVLKGNSEDVARDVAMHVAAMKPDYLVREDVSEEVIEKEKNIIKEQAINEGKPADIAEKMVAGRINKFYNEVCLTEQQFVKDPDLKVLDYVKNNNMTILSFVRYEVGEGIEKRNEDFASEVMKQINN